MPTIDPDAHGDLGTLLRFRKQLIEAGGERVRKAALAASRNSRDP